MCRRGRVTSQKWGLTLNSHSSSLTFYTFLTVTFNVASAGDGFLCLAWISICILCNTPGISSCLFLLIENEKGRRQYIYLTRVPHSVFLASHFPVSFSLILDLDNTTSPQYYVMLVTRKGPHYSENILYTQKQFC